MSLEKKERRKCDICGELISGDYYHCEKRYYTYNDAFTKVSEANSSGWYTPVTLMGGGVCYSTGPQTLDVCTECWEKLQPKEQK